MNSMRCRGHADLRRQPARLGRRRSVEGQHPQVVPRRQAGADAARRDRSAVARRPRDRPTAPPGTPGRGHRDRRRHDPADRSTKACTTASSSTAETQGLEALRRAVDPYTPEEVAGAPASPSTTSSAATRMFASARRGIAVAGTGAEHVVRRTARCSSTSCRASTCCTAASCAPAISCGTRRRSAPQTPRVAQAMPPFPAFGFGAPFRVKGLGRHRGRPTDRGGRRRDPAPGRGPDPRLHQHGRQPTRHLARPAQGARRVPVPRAAGADRPVDVGDRQGGALRDRADAAVRGARDQQHAST